MTVGILLFNFFFSHLFRELIVPVSEMWQGHKNCAFFASTLAKSVQHFCQSNSWLIYSSHPKLPLGAALCGLQSYPWIFCRQGCHGVIRPRHLANPWRRPALCFGTLLHGHLVLVLLSGWFHQASHVSPHHSFSPEVKKDKKSIL